jgi:hypothetical protein
MSKRAYYLMLVVFITFLISQVTAQNEIILPREEQVLLDRHVLTGIKNLAVQILPAGQDFRNNLPPWNELTTEVKQLFDEARIEIIMRPISPEHPNTSISPVLEIRINTIKIKDLQQSVFYIQTSLKTKVQLTGKPGRHIKAVVWETEPVMKAIKTQDAASLITNEVLEQVQAFICAYQAANSPDKPELLNTRTINDQQNNITSLQTKRSLAQDQQIQTQLIASKNSKVFHKADCQWVNKIKPENLVIYNSMEQAVNNDKRPCKQCEP